MTKEQYDNYNGDIYCESCKKYINKKHVSYKRIKSNGNISKCKVCDWFERNNNKCEFYEFTFNEIQRFVEFFIYQESIYLNDIAKELNKTIDELLPLWNFLKIGNKKCLIKTYCEYCGNECAFTPRAYTNSKYHYCSDECYYLDKTNKVKKGKDNPSYNRIKCNCTNCGKEMYIIPYDYNKTNSFGDNNNFCCRKCYAEFRSKYYVNEKGPVYHRLWTEEERAKAMRKYLNRIKDVDYLNTGIQKKIDHLLDALNIAYIREKIFDYYSVDNYLKDYNGIIEVMGDYWHSNPLKYNSSKYLLNQTQSKQLHRDKLKISYIRNHYNINMLYLWENDIDKNSELCMLLISKYINNNCILENYNSFNWYINDDGELNVKNNIIIPYQNIDVCNYKHLIKK